MSESKLAAVDQEIRDALACGESVNSLAVKHGVARSTLQQYIKRHIMPPAVYDLRGSPESEAYADIVIRNGRVVKDRSGVARGTIVVFL